MLLCVPESWVKQTEILAELGGSDMVKTITENIKPIVVRKEEVKTEEKKEEAKVEVKATSETKLKPVDPTSKEKVEKVDAEVVEPTAMFKPVDPVDDGNITMGTRKTCPVKIMPTKKAAYRVQVGKTPATEVKPIEEKLDESLESFKAKLVEKSINLINIKRVPTGLLEVTLLNNFNQPVLITVDNDDTLYGLGVDVFFIGKINPLDEYNRRAFVLTDESLNAVVNNVQIDPKFYVPENVVLLSTMLDTASIHEHDIKKKKAVLEKASKAILEMEPDIKKAMGNEPFRFSFARYKSIDDFALVSGNKSRVSNLHEQKLIASRTIRIEVHEKNVSMNIK